MRSMVVLRMAMIFECTYEKLWATLCLFDLRFQSLRDSSWTEHRSVYPSRGPHPKRLRSLGASAREARSASKITCWSKQSRRHKMELRSQDRRTKCLDCCYGRAVEVGFRACKSEGATHLTKFIVTHIAKLADQRLSLCGRERLSDSRCSVIAGRTCD